jgi:hypothetical protein
MQLEANCRTTAMGIMPHKDIDRALELAMTLDIPFWPQLPHVSLYEDMYVQASGNLPGISVDMETGKVTLDSARFTEELVGYSERMTDPDTFRITDEYSVVYHRFLDKSLTGYRAIRGQQIGPVSFGFKVVDETNRPIIYNDEIKTILYDFMQRKANIQYHELSEKNPNAFVWLDEPGLGWVFSGLTGYDDIQARRDYQQFLRGLEGPPALHLCANVNLPYLLSLGIEILSFDAYQIEVMPRDYSGVVADFVSGGGIISWGIVPVDSSSLTTETPQTLAGRLTDYWGVVSYNGAVSEKQMAEKALIAPARCCLKDIGAVGAPGETGKAYSVPGGEEQLVEKAFGYLGDISRLLQDGYGL